MKKDISTNYSGAEAIVKAEISVLLNELGLPDTLDGHRYLCDALMIAVKEPDSIHHITKDIYPVLAERYNRSNACIERSIRNAVEVMWNGREIEEFPELLEYYEFRTGTRPSNSAFISVLADYLDMVY